MYESPIDIIYSEMQTKLEGKVFKAVQNVGINVNKDELIKALSYDRHQYEKGYADAKAEQQWIPVSSGKLPDDLSEVNITWVNHNPEPYYDFIKDKPASGAAVYYKGRWYWYSQYCVDTLKEYGDCEFDEMDDAIEVTAWMPLIKPWTGGDADGT